jgi:5'-nucleotidase
VHIVLTNDDGVNAPGIRRLCEALTPRYRVTVVAPLAEQSGIGHAFTFKAPLHCQRLEPMCGAATYAVDGTPADCVKYAMAQLLATRPDAVVSGLNVGENSGTSSIYSGTVAAVREAALWGVPGVAFSLMVGAAPHASAYAAQGVELMGRLLALADGACVRARRHTFYNVNFPACPPDQCRGLRVTRQSLAFFDDHYHRIEDERGQEGYLLYGDKVNLETGSEFDSRAILNHIIALTPLQLDATDSDALADLRSLEYSAPGV